MKKTIVFWEGYNAREQRIRNRYENPYPDDDPHNKEWLEGYDHRKKEEYQQIYTSENEQY